MYDGSPVRDASIILVNWSGLSKSCDCLSHMSVLQHTAIVAEVYHTGIKKSAELDIFTGCFRRNSKYFRGGSMDYSE
jgi:hypothetical protein